MRVVVRPCVDSDRTGAGVRDILSIVASSSSSSTPPLPTLSPELLPSLVCWRVRDWLTGDQTNTSSSSTILSPYLYPYPLLDNSSSPLQSHPLNADLSNVATTTTATNASTIVVCNNFRSSASLRSLRRRCEDVVVEVTGAETIRREGRLAVGVIVVFARGASETRRETRG